LRAELKSIQIPAMKALRRFGSRQTSLPLITTSPGSHLAVRLFVSVLSGIMPLVVSAADNPPPGFVALFDGRDLSGWRVPEGDNGHWKVVGGVIDYDAASEARGDKSLWTERTRATFGARR
jgi:hypothetical protein